MKLERMSDFFTARVDIYDEHMLRDVEGCKEGYIRMAELLPENVAELLDLGCGTGLELEAILRRLPEVRVTGIDLTQAMLDKLRQKYPGRRMRLINADYRAYDFGKEMFDAAVSYQTMHHFTHAEKSKLYTRIHAALRPGGQYMECDYMVIKQEDEDFFFRESERIRKDQGLPDGELYHCDTPCTIDNQIKLLSNAGFKAVEMVWRAGNSTLLIAKKQPQDPER